MKIPFFKTEELTGSGQEREGQIVARLERLYRIADDVRRPHEAVWTNNILLLSGDHYNQVEGDLRRWGRRVTTRPPSSRVRLTVNVLYSLVRQAAAGLRDALADQVAVPATTEPWDVAAAELATDWLQQRRAQDEEAEKGLMDVLWAMVAGLRLRATEWDPRLPGLTPNGWVDGLGDIMTRGVNPWRFHLSPWFDEREQYPWIIESDVRDTDEINDLFPGAEVEAEEVAAATDALDRLSVSVVEQADIRVPRREKAALLKQLSVTPRPELPDGGLAIWANGKLLWPDDGRTLGPLPEERMRYVPLRWFPIPGKVYPLPFISPLRDVQREINYTVSQMVELKNRQLRGDVVMSGSGQPETQVIEETGQRITTLPPNTDFKLMRYDLNITTAEQLLARMWQYMMQLAGLHEPTLGEPTGGMPTAYHIATLKESDVAGLTLFRSGFDRAYCEVARQKLLLARNHYHAARLLRVVGEHHEPRLAAFYGSDFLGTDDVRAKPMPLLSEAQKLQVRQEAIGQGLFDFSGPPALILAKARALLALPLPGIREEVDKMLAPMTLEALEEMVGMINALTARATLEAAAAAVQQAQGGPEAGGMPGSDGAPVGGTLAQAEEPAMLPPQAIQAAEQPVPVMPSGRA